jgi:hypothetical protein
MLSAGHEVTRPVRLMASMNWVVADVNWLVLVIV